MTRGLFLVLVAGVDQLEVGAGEVPVHGDVFDRVHEFEGDEAAAGAARGKRLAGKNDDIVILAMSLMVDTKDAGNLRRISRTMQLRVLLRETQDPNPREL